MVRAPNIFSRLTYGLFVAFIYLNIVMPGPYNFIVTAKKYVFFAFVASFCFYALSARAKISFSIVGYVTLAISLVTCMSVFSLVVGNDVEDIARFSSPLLFLLAGPILFGIRGRYKLERYLKHVLASVMIISMITLALACITVFYLNEMALFLRAMDSNFNIIWFPASGVRISVQTAPFMLAGIYIAYYYYAKTEENRYLIACMIIALAIYFTKTVGIWLALLIGFPILVITLKKIRLSSVAAALCVLTAVCVMVLPEIASSWGDKEGSYDVKRQQVVNGVRAFQDYLWLGRGLGFKFTEIDDRNASQSVIEVLPILFLVDGGILGFSIYIFIYFAPVLLALSSRNKPSSVYVITIAHFSIIAAGFTNPYFISGGTGFFFIVLMLAYYRGESSPYGTSQVRRDSLPKNGMAEALR